MKRLLTVLAILVVAAATAGASPILIEFMTWDTSPGDVIAYTSASATIHVELDWENTGSIPGFATMLSKWGITAADLATAELTYSWAPVAGGFTPNSNNKPIDQVVSGNWDIFLPNFHGGADLTVFDVAFTSGDIFGLAGQRSSNWSFTQDPDPSVGAVFSSQIFAFTGSDGALVGSASAISVPLGPIGKLAAGPMTAWSGGASGNVSAELTGTPEPGTFALCGSVLIGVGLFRRRIKKNQGA
jgi:hypothetical protein